MPAEVAPQAAAAVRTAADRGLAFRVLGQFEVPRGPVGYAQGNCEWLMCDAADYPLSRAAGLSVPRRQLSPLRALHQAGLRLDRILLGHELPTGTLGLRGRTLQPMPRERLAAVVQPSRRGLTALRPIAGGVAALAAAPVLVAGLPLDQVVLAAWLHPADPFTATFVDR